MKSLREQIAGKCLHFNGMMNEVCEVGVKYEDVRGPSRGPAGGRLIACFNECDTCTRREMPTEADVAARIEEINCSTVNFTKARSAIVAYLGGHWKKGMQGSQGCIDCPVCQQPKSLHFTRAGLNGNIHARCKTPDCVSWME